MKVLILSCNTGEGHNAAGKAVKECLIKRGHDAVLLDYMQLASKKTSQIVSQGYIKLAKNAPHVFSAVYHLGAAISSSRHKSPVYYANKLMAKYIRKYLEENQFDAVVMPHLYPAETLTYMKKKNLLKIPAVAVATDYTCIPFFEETDCDYYIIPHEDLREEYIKRGLESSRLLPYGIPVKADFSERKDKNQCKEMLHLPKDKPLYLVMSGSMGFGKMHLFAYELANKCRDGEQIVIICGKNKKLKNTLRREFQNNKNVHVIGYTEHVAEFMNACDVIYTKPGGLTSTEALVGNIPIVHTAPIPGCETKNREFFTSRGMSVAANTIFGQVRQGKMLMDNQDLRKGMMQAQKENAHPDAADKIVDLLEKIVAENC